MVPAGHVPALWKLRAQNSVCLCPENVWLVNIHNSRGFGRKTDTQVGGGRVYLEYSSVPNPWSMDKRALFFKAVKKLQKWWKENCSYEAKLRTRMSRNDVR